MIGRPSSVSPTLEGAGSPQGAALLAEVDEHVLAVRSLEDGATLADPFHPTAELVALLEARAKALGAPRPRAVPAPPDRAAALVTAMRAATPGLLVDDHVRRRIQRQHVLGAHQPVSSRKNSLKPL